MSKSFYQTHYHSDIFAQNTGDQPVPQQKCIFNYSLRPKDTVTSLSNYMTTDPQNKGTFHIKVFTKKNKSNLYDSYSNIIPVDEKRHAHNHHLSQTQFELGNDDHKTFIVKKDRTRSLERFPEEHTAYQRKMQEFYGEEYMKYASEKKDIKSTKNIFKKEVYNKNITPSTPCGPKGDRRIRASHSALDITVRPQKKINKEKHNTSQDSIISPRYETRADFLKSNIFNDPVKELVNTYHGKIINPKEADSRSIRIGRRTNSQTANQSFDMNNAANDQGLYYRKPSKILTAKERKYKEVHCSYDNISREYSDSSFSQFYDHKQNDENKQPNTLKERIERSCVLNGPELYEKTCQSNTNRLKGDEIIHKYEIDNVKESDINQLKKCFSNSGIHVYDTTMKDFKINEPSGKITVKIRESGNDKNFQKNFIKAKKMLKEQKGLVLKPGETKPIIVGQSRRVVSKNPKAIVVNNKESKARLENKIQVRKVDNYVPIRKEKITEIPFNPRYKNGFFR